MSVRPRTALVLLGGFRLTSPSGIPSSVRARKAQALLAYLAVAPGRSCSRDEIVALLWGDRAQAQARQSLRQMLTLLRRTPADALVRCLMVNERAVALDLTGIDIDVDMFDRALIEGTPEALRRASELYTGDFLQGFVLDEPPFDSWLRAKRDHLRERAMAGLAALLDHHSQAGNTPEAIQTAVRLLALDPLQEATHRTLMELYVRQGRRGAALKQYHACADMLRRELGVAPEVETRRLYQSIVDAGGNGSLAPAAAVSVGRRTTRQRAPAGLRVSRQPPLVDRADTIDMLLKNFDEARHGRGRVVVIAGEAGVGKTRLLQELSQQAGRRRARVVIGGCHEMTQILPFGPWLEAFRAGGLIRDADVLAGLGAGWRAQLARLFPELDETPSEARTPVADAVHLLHAVVELVAHVAAQRPLLVLLDDLHWADEMTLRMVPSLAGRVADLSVLFVVTLRDDEPAERQLLRQALAAVDREPHVERLSLLPLSRRGTASLIELALRERRAVTAADVEEIWNISDGNPFVILECVRMLIEMQAAGATSRLPRRVHDLIAARLEGVDMGHRSLLAAAAVIGREFDFSLLRQAIDGDPGAVTVAVEDLVRRRLLKVIDSRFAFAHERLREAVVADLLPPRRALLHAAVGRAIEVCYRDLSPFYGDLAVHFLAAEVWDKALTYCRRAAAQAIERAAHREAVSWLKRALDALAHLPQDREMLAAAIDLRLTLRSELRLLGESGPIHELEVAAKIARDLHDERREARAQASIAYALTMIGQLNAAEHAGREALTIAERIEDSELCAAATLVMGHALKAQGRFREALQHYRANIESLTGELRAVRFGSGRPAIMSRAHAAWCLAELGDFVEGRRLALEALRLADELNDHTCQSTAHWAVGLLFTRQGALDDAVRILEAGVEISRKWDLLGQYSPSTGSVLGTAYALLGRLDEALPLLEAAIDRYLERQEIPRFAWVSEALVMAGRLDEARKRAKQALAAYRSIGDRCFEGWALRLLGEIETAADSPTVASHHLSAALNIAKCFELQPLAARCRLDLGLLYQRTGNLDLAHSEIDRASNEFRALGMTYWLARAASARAAIE